MQLQHPLNLISGAEPSCAPSYVYTQDSTHYDKTLELLRKYDPDFAAAEAKQRARLLAQSPAAQGGRPRTPPTAAQQVIMPANQAEEGSAVQSRHSVHGVRQACACKDCTLLRAMRRSLRFGVSGRMSCCFQSIDLAAECLVRLQRLTAADVAAMAGGRRRVAPADRRPRRQRGDGRRVAHVPGAGLSGDVAHRRQPRPHRRPAVRGTCSMCVF